MCNKWPSEEMLEEIERELRGRDFHEAYKESGGTTVLRRVELRWLSRAEAQVFLEWLREQQR
jgi:hypothetical protein